MTADCAPVRARHVVVGPANTASSDMRWQLGTGCRLTRGPPRRAGRPVVAPRRHRRRPPARHRQALRADAGGGRDRVHGAHRPLPVRVPVVWPARRARQRRRRRRQGPHRRLPRHRRRGRLVVVASSAEAGRLRALAPDVDGGPRGAAAGTGHGSPASRTRWRRTARRARLRLPRQGPCRGDRRRRRRSVLGVVALGRCSDGHDDLAVSRSRPPAAEGCALEITGLLDDPRSSAHGPGRRAARRCGMPLGVGVAAVLDRRRSAPARRRQRAHGRRWPSCSASTSRLYDGTPDALADAAAAALDDPPSTWTTCPVRTRCTLAGVTAAARQPWTNCGGRRDDAAHRRPAVVGAGQPLGPRARPTCGSPRSTRLAVIIPYFEQPDSLRRMYAALEREPAACDVGGGRRRRRVERRPACAPGRPRRPRPRAAPGGSRGPPGRGAAPRRRSQPTRSCSSSSTPTPCRPRARSPGWRPGRRRSPTRWWSAGAAMSTSTAGTRRARRRGSSATDRRRAPCATRRGWTTATGRRATCCTPTDAPTAS